MTSGDSVSGQVGRGLDFDGSNDFVSVPHDVSLDWGAGGEFTIESAVNVVSGGGPLEHGSLNLRGILVIQVWVPDWVGA